MEYKRRVKLKRRLSTHEEELIREVDYDSSFGLDGDEPLYSNKYVDEGCLSESMIEPFFIEGTQTYTSIHQKRSPCTKSLDKPLKYNVKRYKKVCQMCNHTQLNMHLTKTNGSKSGRIDKATLIVTNTSSEDSIHYYDNVIYQLQRRIDELERKVHGQELIFRSISTSFTVMPSIEHIKDHDVDETPRNERPECSYIEQYNQMPETSGFQRTAQCTSSLPPSKASSVTRERKYENYLRNFTTYDGITTRGRRCASVPLKRINMPTKAADRIQRIRHKLNPVKDYKLMDTVHYLAQGEFAPRDDGIKLTPSREAVLSDIIWEDVCRTHWPSTRLAGRRTTRQERVAARAELQRLVDNLLRERVTHAERRRRKQYRIIKLNQSTVGNVGKTGDIIVASNKNKHLKENRQISGSEHATITSSKRYSMNRPKIIQSNENQPSSSEICGERHVISHDESEPLASSGTRSENNKCDRKICGCPIASTSTKIDRSTLHQTNGNNFGQERTNSNNMATKSQVKNPRYIVKKDTYGMRNKIKECPNLEHYILLPTLVIRTPSNVRRQKKFNELYHRLIHFHGSDNGRPHESSDDTKEYNCSKRTAPPSKKDIGLNFNIVLSESEQDLQKATDAQWCVKNSVLNRDLELSIINKYMKDASKCFFDMAKSHPNPPMSSAATYAPPLAHHFLRKSRNILSDLPDALTTEVESVIETRNMFLEK
ncbi:hypothetical protein EVAR_20963_1 [Eumeta japonica]|uniref:Uncharacterized protein n=1 Tax=Eumeta variegata TaxID=151549 RepID=A0A4C1V6F8_EUMVA|nr:hypothetical protein EVAR_20963_1 [Eumeta japonica]